jgi:hypothetical protein
MPLTPWRNVALVLGALIFALVLIEVIVRFSAGVRVLRVANFIGERVDFSGVHHIDYDERLGWVSRPYVHDRHVNTGAYGIRLTGRVDRPVPQAAILASGDSFTWGGEVDDDESWPAYMETITGTPVLNAATGAWGTDQIVMRAETLIEVAHPGILILGFFAHDIGRAEQAVNFGAPKPYFTIETGELILHNVPVPRPAATTHGLGLDRAVLGYSYAVVWLAERLGLHSWLYRDYVEFSRATPEGIGEEITCLLLKRLAERTEHEHIRLILVAQYPYSDFPEPQPPSSVAVLKCARDLGIETIDTWRPLAELYASDRARFGLQFVRQTDAPHMSAIGNKGIAAQIAKRLQGP